MTAIAEQDFERNLRPRERHWPFPRIALRRFSANHPMILFVTVVLAAFVTMALVPPSGVAMTSFGQAPAGVARAGAMPSSGLLPEVAIVCHGQAWGAESAECLAMIATESGRPDGHPVRVIAGL